MKKIKSVEKKESEFLIINSIGEAFSGLRSGLPKFSPDWNLGKPLSNEKQFICVQRGCLDKLEKLYL